MKSLGVGVGLRREHFNFLLEKKAQVDFFEVIPENFMDFGGKPRKVLKKVASQYPLVAHGVSLSLGGAAPLNLKFINNVKNFMQDFNIKWFTDHICFSSGSAHEFHDLIPLLQSPETIKHIVERILQVQDILKQPIGIENISYYVKSKFHQMSEVEFINEIAKKSGAYLLLDINNIYVNSKNHHFNPQDFLKKINKERVAQIHLAGHHHQEDFFIDTHGDYICEDVWNLYRYFLKIKKAPVSTIIEWDSNLPSFSELEGEVLRAKKINQELFE